MQEFKNAEIDEALKVAAFVVVISIAAIVALITFSIIRDERSQNEIESRSKHSEIPRELSRDRRSRP